MLSFSALGYSLPDLSVTGFAAPIAAYGQPLAVSVAVYNRGASSINEPLHLNQGSISTADAPASTIKIFASNRPGGKNAVFVGSIDVPPIHQNDVVTGTGTFVLPAQPAGFPGNGGHIFLTFIENPGRTFNEASYTNNIFVSRQAVTISPALPNLKLVGFDVPGSLQPGDSLDPAIRIANIGAADTAEQGPLLVQIVASENSTYGPGDAILASYIVPNVPALSTAPSTSALASVINLQPGNNIVTLSGQPITLPTMPNTYFLGVKINPLGTIVETGKHLTPQFDAVVKVGPPIPGVPPSNFVGTGTGTTPPPEFPFPFGPRNSTVTAANLDLTTRSVGSIQSAAIQNSNRSNLRALPAVAKPLASSPPILIKPSRTGD